VTTTWTAVFERVGLSDTPEEVARSLNGLVGAHLHRALRQALVARGWAFQEAWPEDHGWHGEASFTDEQEPVVAHLVTCPELDRMTPGGDAEQGRWRVVIGMDLGLLRSTKSRRTEHLRRLAVDVQEACEGLGAKSIVWEVGGP
jgi:hypothetical protein